MKPHNHATQFDINLRSGTSVVVHMATRTLLLPAEAHTGAALKHTDHQAWRCLPRSTPQQDRRMRYSADPTRNCRPQSDGCWSSFGSAAAYCQNKTLSRPMRLHRLGGAPQQGFVEQRPVLSVQAHADPALDDLSQLQDRCVWILAQCLLHSTAHTLGQMRSHECLPGELHPLFA